jgi:hypothetical protein
MDWIDVNDEMFEYAGQRTREADTALDQPTATKHDIEPSKWYNSVAAGGGAVAVMLSTIIVRPIAQPGF